MSFFGVVVKVYDQIYFWYYLTDLVFAAPTVLTDIASIYSLWKKWHLGSNMKWIGLDKKEKNRLHYFSHGGQKNLSNQKVYCKADWKSAHAQETQVNFLKKLEGFQNITWTWDTVYKLRIWYKLPWLYGSIKAYKSFVKVYWGWKSSSAFISKLPHTFQ